MRRLFPLGLILIVACSRTPTTNEMPDALAEESLATMDRLTAELRNIKDRESWLKSRDRIFAIAQRMESERERGNELLKMNLPTRQKMEDKYRDRLAESGAALKAEFERIVRDVDRGKDYVRQIRELMAEKLDEANQKVK